jgi:tetratricopeptide (TPR) repeat protein
MEDLLMNIGEIPFNMKVNFDEYLREVPEEIDEMKKGIKYLFYCLNTDESPSLHGLIGVYSRIVGLLDDAEKHIKQALSLYQNEQKVSGILTNKIRLAHVYQWKEEFNRADSLYEEVIEDISDNQHCLHLLDFVYQHYGKSKFDQKDYIKALELFEKAFEIRVEKDNQELIKSTEHAINITKQFLLEDSKEKGYST